jgi:topoisomerase-4 subunit A
MEEDLYKDEELNKNSENQIDDIEPKVHSKYNIPLAKDESSLRHLPGMFLTWFLDYGSYVILDRAIPHIIDGLKPVQRRILHSMKRMEDGRYNKVANIIGHTMQFHPHGDSSIGGALTTLGQKNILIDCQGNWGNILTGDSAAAPRYIEARLSKFALDAVFNSKTTQWKPSYDGRNEEPAALPVKFSLLLAQGSEGIGVGLNSKILPHNFGELLDASIAYLKNEEFTLYPDFITGGMVDVSRYNDGGRGGRVKIRAKIEKSADNKSLIITEIPFGVTTDVLKKSILEANDKGKINIKKIDDNTAENVEIVVHLEAKTSSDKTIDALYAFSKCEVSYSPNCCVIDDDKPIFTTVSHILKRNTDNTVELLRQELEIQKHELKEQLLFISLEKIFIDERIYKDKEFENAKSLDYALNHIDNRIEPYKKSFIREIVREDLLKLLEIRMARILKFNTDKASENIANLKEKIKDVEHKLAHIIDYTIEWFEYLQKTYGKNYPRLTEIRNFETIEVTKVAEANSSLFVSREEGFIGTNLKKDDKVEFVSKCSDIDDIIVFFKDGKYKIVKIAEKLFVGRNIEHIAVFLKNDRRTTYNVVYRDGKNGVYYIKRFSVSGITRDKEYDLTNGAAESKIVYFSANPNGEAETVRVQLRPTSRRIKKMTWDLDFSLIAIKGRASRGNLLTKFPVLKICLKQRGGSTLGGTHIWLDKDILRLNFDRRGEYLGEFFNDDQILVVTKNGDFYTVSFDLTTHFDADYLIIEKFSAEKIWSCALFDAEQNFFYIKRFPFEISSKRVSFIGENPLSKLQVISDADYPQFKVIFGGKDAKKEPLLIDVEQFIGEKSYKAKGKRISVFQIENIEEIEPVCEAETEAEDELFDEIFESEEPKITEEILEEKDTKKPFNIDERAKPTLIYDKDNNSEDSGQLSLF